MGYAEGAIESRNADLQSSARSRRSPPLGSAVATERSSREQRFAERVAAASTVRTERRGAGAAQQEATDPHSFWSLDELIQRQSSEGRALEVGEQPDGVQGSARGIAVSSD